MKVFTNAAEAGDWSPNSVLAIGGFESMHLGHRDLIGRALTNSREMFSRCLVVTFDPLPKELFTDGYKAMISLESRIEQMRLLGVDGVVVLPFDKSFACQEPVRFADEIISGALKAIAVFVGKDFCFGNNRSGNFETMEKLGVQKGFLVHGVELLEKDGEKIGTTAIRRLVTAGEKEKAETILGRPIP